VRAPVAVTALVFWMVSAAYALEPSTSVFPSEDEALEARIRGEINSYQYGVLQEIIQHGVDTAAAHLFDEIPNLAYFLSPVKSLATSLQVEQTKPFVKPSFRPGKTTGTVSYIYYQELEQDERARYRTAAHLYFSEHLQAAFRLHREYTGRERIVSRWLSYRNRQGALQEVTLGNFTARMGLGGIFGYRGKLLAFSDRIDEESLLFPDYGGYNGVHVRARWRRLDIEALTSVTRDDRFTLVSAGGMMALEASPLRSAVIIGVNRLKNRDSGERIRDFKYALQSLYRYQAGYFSFELTGQAGERASWGAALAEGKHRFDRAEINYAVWWYDDDYLDLSGGGKAGSLYRTVTVDRVGFTFSDKRSGQEGGMLKSIVLMSPHVEMVNSAIFSRRTRDTLDFRFLSGLVGNVSRRLEVRLDYWRRIKRRRLSSQERDVVEQRTRLEGRINTGDLSVRTYIAYNTKSGNRDNVSLFLHVRYRHADDGMVEVWSNLARLDMDKGAIDYWYVYVRNQQRLFPHVTAAVKLSHRYNRDAGEKHYTVVSLEVNTSL
jgi:hypothetical protein